MPAPEDDDGDDHHWFDDPAGLELRADDTEPADDVDQLAEQLSHTDTRWSLELDNPYLWLPEPVRPQRSGRLPDRQPPASPPCSDYLTSA